MRRAYLQIGFGWLLWVLTHSVWTQSVWTQSVWAQPVVRLEPGQTQVVLNEAVGLWIDAHQEQAFDDVVAPGNDDRFRVHTDGAFNFGYTNAVYWLRLRLQNEQAGRRWLLEIDNPSTSLVALYTVDSTGTSIKTGAHYPFVERPLQHRTFLFPVVPAAEQPEVLYLRLFSHEPMRFNLRLWQPEAFHVHNQTVQLLLGMYYGLLVVIMLYNLALFLATREAGYGLLAVLMLTLGLLQFISDGLAYAYFWPEATEWNQESRGLLNGLLGIWVGLFARQFLDTARTLPRIDVWLQGLIVLSASLALLKLFGYLESYAFWPQVYSHGLGVLIIIGLVVAYVRKAPLLRRQPGVYGVLPSAFLVIAIVLGWVPGPYSGIFDRIVNTVVSLGSLLIVGGALLHRARASRPIRVFAVAFEVIAVSSLVRILLHIGVLPLTTLTEYGNKVGMAAGFVLLSFSLGDRFRLLEQRATVAEAVAAEEQRASVEARLEALQAKINPHFLFNVLNSIAALIPLDARRAVRAVEKLARLFRYTLRSSGQALVTLPEELALVEAYLELEHLRLGERLRYDVYTEGNLERVRLPALTVQPLVENSVKYAVAARKTGGSIQIRAIVEADQCRLSVADDGPGWVEPVSGNGYGLTSIEERLRLLFGNDAEVEIDGTSGVTVTVTLPLAPTPMPAA